MVNEAIQWTILAILVMFVFGILRQVALMLPPSARAEPSGPPAGRKLPRRLIEEIRRSAGNETRAESVLLAFVTESCTGCQHLLSNLAKSTNGNGDHVVLVARSGSTHFREAIEDLQVPTVWDNGTIWRACDITATPLVVSVDRNGNVIAKEVTHNVERLAHSHS